jgi:hypothetical protein
MRCRAGILLRRSGTAVELPPTPTLLGVEDSSFVTGGNAVHAKRATFTIVLPSLTVIMAV